MGLDQSLFSFFTDPLLRGPTLGCMLMSLAASLMGVVVFLRKESLIGETLSHTSYPGVVIGILVAGIYSIPATNELFLTLMILSGAFFTALLGLWGVHLLKKKARVPGDAALCFILSTFFGVGLTIASEVQISFTSLYKQALSYLYGQAATMTDDHIVIYGILSLFVVTMIGFFYKEIKVITFDRQYAISLGMRVSLIEVALFFLLVLSVIIGIRSVGVVLMSAMLIAPAVAARQFTHKLSVLFFLAAFFGMASGFFGNFFSVILTDQLAVWYPSARIILPTGPMIVIVATIFCVFALLFAPERGLMVRLLRITLFRRECICENILKVMWRWGPDQSVSLNEISNYQSISLFYLKILMSRMIKEGWIEKESSFRYFLTLEGKKRAANIVRLHRLWELYLSNFLGVEGERIHRNAEEMEHILTPELEAELTLLLNNPKKDPHQQPIPSRMGEV